MSFDIKDTSAWRIIEQIAKHFYGLQSDIGDDEVFLICRMFWKSGGIWKELINGDMSHIKILDICIGNVIKANKLNKIATRVANK